MTLFDGSLSTTFGFLYLASGDFLGEEHGFNAFKGQANGLCGGAIQGGLVLNVGVHTGSVKIRVDTVDAVPPIDLDWEEIVEASVVLTEPPVYLRACATDSAAELKMAPGIYRARFCARAFGATDDKLENAAQECYALLLWPDIDHPDVLIRETNRHASYLHRTVEARKATPPLG